MRKLLASALAIMPLLPATAMSQQQGDAERGRALFQRQCGACHQAATPHNGVGPTLQGVMGRTAGAVEGFNYSPAMRASGIVWTRETLDTYLANPTVMVRGTRMVQRVASEAHRGDIIAFLESMQNY